MLYSATSDLPRFTAPFRGRMNWRKVALYAATLLILLLGMQTVFSGHFNTLAAVILLGFLILIAVKDMGMGIRLCLMYLILMGDIRRIMNMTGDVPKFDPLLLIGPVFSIIFAVPLLMRLRLKDAMSKAVLALMVVMFLEIFNPKQGGILVGFAGAMFYIVPLLWFWLGQRYGTLEFLETILIRTVLPLGVLAALLGIFQTYVGFLPWEQAWIEGAASHTRSFNLGGGFIRSFGYSVNPLEFVGVLLASCTSCIGLVFAGRRVYGLLVPLLAFVIFLSSSRNAVLSLLYGIMAMWALSKPGGKAWGYRLVLAIVVVAGGLLYTASQVSSAPQTGDYNSAAGASTQHQLQMLRDPSHSTAGLHSQMFVSGILKGITYPIGYGLGATTLGSGKLGGDQSAAGSSEVDLSDVFTGTGVVGGVLYLLIYGLIANRVVRFSRLAPKHIGLPVLGVVACTVGGWLAAGRYSTTVLIWFLLGSICKLTMHRDALAPVSVANTVHERHA